jgi:hypothetical protein
MDAAQYRQAQSNSLLQALFGRISHFRTGRNGWTKTELCEAAGMEPITAAKMLANFDELDLWRGLLNYKSPGIRLQTLQYLTDRRDGKARQAVNVSGGRVHAHTVYRDLKLAGLSAEELNQLDVLTKKLALPSPDGPRNQIESNTDNEATV